MGATEQCIEQEHEACVATWCDCGCHHDLIDAHHQGEHATPNERCQECRRAVVSDEWDWVEVDGKRLPPERAKVVANLGPPRTLVMAGSSERPAPMAGKFWLGDHPRPCTCLGGPCDGGEDGCGYDPVAWDAWEKQQRGSR